MADGNHVCIRFQFIVSGTLSLKSQLQTHNIPLANCKSIAFHKVHFLHTLTSVSVDPAVLLVFNRGLLNRTFIEKVLITLSRKPVLTEYVGYLYNLIAMP